MLTFDDYGQWRGLFRGYADFYQVSSTDRGVQATRSWLIDADHACTGLVAEKQGQLVGLAHFYSMPIPSRGQIIGFFDDLFVVLGHRSSGVEVALIITIKAKTLSLGIVRWITRVDNDGARSWYDKLAEETKGKLCEMAAK